MFAQRLKWFCILLTVIALVIIARLVDIQILHAETYEGLSARLLTRPVRYVRAPRGSILDRHGTMLVSDEPAADICVHYAILAGREDYLRAVARALRKRGDYPGRAESEIMAELRAAVPDTWLRLAQLSGTPLEQFTRRRNDLYARVERVRADVQRRSPTVVRVKEESQMLPMVEDVDRDLALSVRLELERYPWLRVVPGSRRVAHDADSLAHVLGRLGAASRERIDEDELKGDELRSLRPEDRCGISGIERLAENTLRGARGRIIEEFDRSELERLDPVRGHDVYLTIDLELQRQALAILEDAVTQTAQHPCGAAAVVLDVATRDVLVLASYPSYEYDAFSRDYETLRQDTRHLPLLFRAVAGQYPPGSTCKAITLVGGLSEEVINRSTRFHCTGFLLAENPNAFRCWIYNQHPGLTHDALDNPDGLDALAAIKNSCNIYFFHVGERLGAGRLCDWFTRFGLGRTQGTGLIEESAAIVPSEEWLRRAQGRGHLPADAWNYAIGQGEVTATPLQAANVAATIAAGRWAPVHLAYDDAGRPLGAPRDPVAEDSAAHPFNAEHLAVLRQGMWAVVNERGGTAHYAQLDDRRYELCGKTGSAQAVPRVVSYRYTCEWPDGRREDVIALSREDALARFPDDPPRIVGARAAERYPAWEEGENLPSHAWFIGFVQPARTPRGTAPAGRTYAIAVVIEYGGSGGRIAGPAAKKIIEAVLEKNRE